MTHTRTRLLGRMTLATATLAVLLTSWAPAFAGDPDLDPDVGQSWLQASTTVLFEILIQDKRLLISVCV
mgnify:CR=1 FL=1